MVVLQQTQTKPVQMLTVDVWVEVHLTKWKQNKKIFLPSQVTWTNSQSPPKWSWFWINPNLTRSWKSSCKKYRKCFYFYFVRINTRFYAIRTANSLFQLTQQLKDIQRERGERDREGAHGRARQAGQRTSARSNKNPTFSSMSLSFSLSFSFEFLPFRQTLDRLSVCAFVCDLIFFLSFLHARTLLLWRF